MRGNRRIRENREWFTKQPSRESTERVEEFMRGLRNWNLS